MSCPDKLNPHRNCNLDRCKITEGRDNNGDFHAGIYELKSIQM